jgi:hypothetical protein
MRGDWGEALEAWPADLPAGAVSAGTGTTGKGAACWVVNGTPFELPKDKPDVVPVEATETTVVEEPVPKGLAVRVWATPVSASARR